MDYCCAAGGVEGLGGKSKLQILRDGIQILELYQARKCGCTRSLDEVHFVARGGKVEGAWRGALVQSEGDITGCAPYCGRTTSGSCAKAKRSCKG